VKPLDEGLLELHGEVSLEEEEVGELLGITLYALAETPTPRTIQVIGKVGP
jgi:hypothetical protein